jgi:hypothetical protein
LVEPKREWRIVTSDAHSTTWDGAETLFDFNFLALGIEPDEAWALASKHGTVMPVGKGIKVHFAQHYIEESWREALTEYYDACAQKRATYAIQMRVRGAWLAMMEDPTFKPSPSVIKTMAKLERELKLEAR